MSKSCKPNRYPFPVPIIDLRLVTPTSLANAVAFLTIDDTLRLMDFEQNGIRIIDVDHDYISQVCGGELVAVAPTLISNKCAYLQSRRLIVYNLEKRAHEVYRITSELEEMAVFAKWFSMEPKVVIAQLEDTTNYDDGERV